jgi:hypothetical protein
MRRQPVAKQYEDDIGKCGQTSAMKVCMGFGGARLDAGGRSGSLIAFFF